MNSGPEGSSLPGVSAQGSDRRGHPRRCADGEQQSEQQRAAIPMKIFAGLKLCGRKPTHMPTVMIAIKRTAGL